MAFIQRPFQITNYFGVCKTDSAIEEIVRQVLWEGKNAGQRETISYTFVFFTPDGQTIKAKQLPMPPLFSGRIRQPETIPAALLLIVMVDQIT